MTSNIYLFSIRSIRFYRQLHVFRTLMAYARTYARNYNGIILELAISLDRRIILIREFHYSLTIIEECFDERKSVVSILYKIYAILLYNKHSYECKHTEDYEMEKEWKRFFPSFKINFSR